MLGGMKSPSVGCDCDVSFRSGVCVMVHGVLELRGFEIGRVGSMQHATQQKIRVIWVLIKNSTRLHHGCELTAKFSCTRSQLRTRMRITGQAGNVTHTHRRAIT